MMEVECICYTTSIHQGAIELLLHFRLSKRRNEITSYVLSFTNQRQSPGNGNQYVVTFELLLLLALHKMHFKNGVTFWENMLLFF